jgi:RNA polymerase sigma-70 factor, ECF subfamily
MAAPAADSRAEGGSASDPFRQNMVAIIPSLRAFARGLCGDRDMADDLAQEAIMRAWRARDSYTEGTNFRAWMFKIVRNLFYTAHRKNARMSSWDPEAAERLLVAPPTQHVGIDVSDVAEALNRLPAEQREVRDRHDQEPAGSRPCGAAQIG